MTMEFKDVARTAAAVATGHLGWSPTRFWRVTPAELQLALEGRFGTAPALGRLELDELREKLGDG